MKCATGKLSLPLKTHGGKHYLASKITALFPPHLHYVEPFCGGCAVLLASDGEGRSELVNDINGNLTNFWRVLQGVKTFAELARRLESVPLSRIEWIDSADLLDSLDEVERAAAFFIHCRQSLAGRMKSFTAPTRTRTRRGMNGNVSEWLGAVDGLAETHARLRRVFIESMPAVDLIRREDTEGTLFYCDPPYLAETRTAPEVYQHEMTRGQHAELLSVLLKCKGTVFLSGYRSELYDTALADWRKTEWTLPNSSGHGATKQDRVECLWDNTVVEA